MSTIRASRVQTAVGGPVAFTKQDAAKTWIYVIAAQTSILGSVNVTSYTDTGTGDGTANLTNAFSSSTSYASTIGTDAPINSGNATQWSGNSVHTSASAIRVVSYLYGDSNSAYGDVGKSISAFGALA